MKKKQEQKRIIQKINDRKIFQAETWENLDFILMVLAEHGFGHIWEAHTKNLKEYGGHYYLQNQNNEKASVSVANFLGKYIQVEFY